ncbi:AraC family transcriptional regulator [Streptomyces sp. G-5]|uniref:AraC family transcriptional regulator n=1 Tax=Streptomyces sp. G-5 TaxID=2977231 RepID=UPI0021CFCCBF|nr:AraC family transcriptional regulator [Streptomyces sp. G-5]MCU4745450.1 AraC family transcriptional regulator [Streptomyces sp. G-5]
MDSLASLLEGPRAHRAFLLRAVFDPPWCVQVRDRAPLTVLCAMRDTTWITPEDQDQDQDQDPGRVQDPVRIDAGDIAVVRGPAPYRVGSGTDVPVQVVVHPGDVTTTPEGEGLCEQLDLGVRTWGSGPDGAAQLLIGTYHVDGEVSGRLLRALPQVLVLREADWDCPLLPLVAEEIGKDRPGQSVVLDRLLDLLLIAVLRAWFARPEARAPAWYRAQADPVVGRALRLLHEDPAHPWTVAALAARAGASRAAFARRFATLVGRPPMAYLTDWRLALAADLLREPAATLDAVARRVGYGSGFALSTAFKRERGISPSLHRVSAG